MLVVDSLSNCLHFELQLCVSQSGGGMAAAHVAPPCALRVEWGSCDWCVLGLLLGRDGVGGSASGETVRWARVAVGVSSRRVRPIATRWGRSEMCCARFGYGGSSAKEEEEDDDDDDDASVLVEITALVDGLFQLNQALTKASELGVGAEIHSRVDVVYNRATLLKFSVDRMVAAGGRVPVQLTVTLKGLQREYASVENIVRLVMEAGPVIPGIINDVEDDPSELVSPMDHSKESGEETMRTDVFFKEKGESEASIFELLIRQKSLEAAFGTEQCYAMSTLAADGSSPFAAFRREIEHRVMEKLALEKKQRVEQHEEPGEGDAGLENGVHEPVQNLPLRGRLQESGAATDGSEIDAPERRVVHETQNQSSLTDAQEQQSSELEKVREDLSALEQQLASAKGSSDRAERAEAELQQLTKTMAARVPLDTHQQVVKLERESLVMARKKIAQVTAELREKEVILGAVKQEMKTERNRLQKQVTVMSGEVSKRASVEEVEAAIATAVRELETELRTALQRADSLELELATNQTLFKQIQKKWDSERAGLRGELASVKDQVTELEQEQAADRTSFVEAVEKVYELEDSVSRVQQSMVEEEEGRINKEKFILATLKSLVAEDTAKTNRESNAVEPTWLLEASEELVDRSKRTDSEASEQMSSVAGELESMLPDEKAVALETFFHVMGGLIYQESQRLETMNHRLRDSAILKPGFRKLGRSSKVRKPVITLYYESSWEFAYLHYSADSSGWTEVPGVCMRDDMVASNVPLKVIDIEGSSIEFVLTDGKGSWDCAPIGGNYHIENSGTFVLSSGFIEQKQ